MTYRPGHLRERSKEIINARNWGVGIITTLLGLRIFISEVNRIRESQLEPMNYAYWALFALTSVLIFLWIWATQKELDLLFDWLDPEKYELPSTLKETLLILFLGFILITLLFAARDPLLYALVFTFYSVILLPSARYMNKEIKTAIEHSKRRLDEDMKDPTLTTKTLLYRAALDILQDYFLESPIIPRLVLIILISIIGVFAALYWKISHRILWGLSTYAIFFTLISISEIVINRWRCIRDERLREINAELFEYLRNEEKMKDPLLKQLVKKYPKV